MKELYTKVSSNLNFVEREKATRKFWEENGIFEKSIEQRKCGDDFTFYDGPPTANGKPHIGHVLTRVIKDMIPRYQTMKGKRVLRKAGWDTHGLPVELEVEKKLGIDGKDQIESYGLEPFIAHCKESVWKYQDLWEKMSERVGYWMDMENPYVTYSDDYIESEWWALKTISDKGLLYKGHKVVPYCPRCGTALSSHEVSQGYKLVKERSAVVRFKVKGEENTYVNISHRRDGAELTLDVIRKRVDTKNVTYSIDENKIGYIKITSFKSNTASQFVEAVSFLEENGAVGVIYDLRSNPGGYLSSVVSILSYIAPDDAIIVSFSNDYGAPKYDNHSHSFLIPSVVLCNENTASAGELFTAAMRDFDDKFGYLEVTTVGNTTYGKGVMQSTFELGDGSTLTMTVAFYNPPCGENYDGEGIKPDVKTDAVEGMDAQLDAAYTEIANLVK